MSTYLYINKEFKIKEEQLQAILVQQLKDYYPNYLIFLSMSGIHLPVSSKVKAQIMSTLRKQGFIRGIPDISIQLPKGVSLHVEMKRTDGGVQSADQKEVQKALISLGHKYYLCNSVQCVFKAIIENTTEEERISQYERLISTVKGTSKLTEDFLFFKVGHSIDEVKELVQRKYGLI